MLTNVLLSVVLAASSNYLLVDWSWEWARSRTSENDLIETWDFISAGRCERKIKMELVLLRELSKNGAGMPLRKCDFRTSQPGWNLTYWPARNSRYLLDLCPKTICDSLRTNVFWFTLESIIILTRQLLTTCGQRTSPAISLSQAYCSNKAINHCRYTQQCTIRGQCTPRGLWMPRGFRMEKNKILVWDSQDTNQRNDFSESKLLHLPIHRKALKSLT